MSELDQLRSLGDQVVPPSFELLRETARRRDRRHSVAAVLASAAAVVVVVVGIALLADSDGERTATSAGRFPRALGDDTAADVRRRRHDPLRRADTRRARTGAASSM